jgi:hypothetical protein
MHRYLLSRLISLTRTSQYTPFISYQNHHLSLLTPLSSLLQFNPSCHWPHLIQIGIFEFFHVVVVVVVVVSILLFLVSQSVRSVTNVMTASFSVYQFLFWLIFRSIFIKTLSGGLIPIEVQPSDTISLLKQALSHFPGKNLSLVFFSSIIYSMTSSPFVSFPLQL